MLVYLITQGCSSAGRVAVSKTVGRGFKSSRPCHISTVIRIRYVYRLTVLVYLFKSFR